MNLLDRLSSFGLRPRQVSTAKGGEYACACPGCGGADKPGDPSDRFHAWPEQEGGPICQEAGVLGTYWCRKCGAGGDMLQFLLDFEAMGFAEACFALGANTPKKLPMRGRLPQPPKPAEVKSFAPATADLPNPTWRERAASMVAKSHERLLNTPDALAWLTARGLDLAAVRKYRLGYLAEEPNKAGTSTGIFRAYSAWGLPDKETRNTDGTLSKKRSLWIPRGIVIPAFEPGAESDPAALPIRLRIRRRVEDIAGTNNPKYFVVPGSCMAPMLLGAHRRAVVVVEAELDNLLLHHLAGDVCGALAVLTNLGKPDARAHAVLSRAITVLVALDYDIAGAKGWTWWRENFPQAKRWPVPTAKDPGDAFAQGEDLRLWILAGLPAMLRTPAAPSTPAVAAPQPQDPSPVGASLPGALPPQGEGVEHQAATPAQPAESAPPVREQAPAAPQLNPVQRAALGTALKRLAAFMARTGLVYGPDSTGTRAWIFPSTLSPREADALFDELLPLVPNDVYQLVMAHPERVVTAGNVCAALQTQRRTS